MNRLVEGVSDESFNEKLSYDAMGNISTLERTPMGVNTYGYEGNQLKSISGFLNGNYSYDGSGNLKVDGPKGLTITYNHLNLPSIITKGTERMNNTWLATRTKVKKVVGSLTRDYVGVIEYNNNSIEFIQNEEGRARPNGNSYFYEYMLKDHLGNTRVMIDQNGTVLESSDYYPFGLQVARGGQTVPSPEHRYKYNGKELQTELGLDHYDYGMRFYDPVIARFTTIDPMAEKYKRWSTYTYSLNNPIKYVDPRGDTVRIAITGNVVGSDKIRVVSSKDFWNYVKTVDTYQMTVTDDVSSTGSDYAVTRDGPLAVKDADGRYTGDDNNKYRMDNTGFEPSGEVGEYQGAIRTDGKAGGRVELRDRNDVNNATVDGRSNVQIHVGGTYTIPRAKEEPQDHLAVLHLEVRTKAMRVEINL